MSFSLLLLRTYTKRDKKTTYFIFTFIQMQYFIQVPLLFLFWDRNEEKWDEVI